MPREKLPRPKSIHKRWYSLFAQRLRRARLDAGLSQIAAAKALKRPQTYIAKSEASDRRVDVFELREFARVYRKPITYFFDAD